MRVHVLRKPTPPPSSTASTFCMSRRCPPPPVSATPTSSISTLPFHAHDPLTSPTSPIRDFFVVVSAACRACRASSYAERGREPRQPYHGGGCRGGYTDGQTGYDYVHPRWAYECHSGTGRGYEMKLEGAGRGNWGTVTDEGLAQETVETVNTEETAAVPEDEKNPDDAPQSEVKNDKEGAEDEEEEKKPEDKWPDYTLKEVAYGLKAARDSGARRSFFPYSC